VGRGWVLTLWLELVEEEQQKKRGQEPALTAIHLAGEK
jgi:hypothetical protein